MDWDEFRTRLTALGFRTWDYNSEMFGRFMPDGRLRELRVYDGDPVVRRFVECMAPIFEIALPACLNLQPASQWGVASSFSPSLEFVRAEPMKNATLSALLSAPQLARLAELDLSGNSLDDEAVEMLTNCPHLTGIDVLLVGSCETYGSDTDTLKLPAEISAEGRARLRECFGDQVLFADEAQPHWRDLTGILESFRNLLSWPDNDFGNSPWADRDDALAEIDARISELADGRRPSALTMTSIRTLFAPTGPIQDVAEASRWSNYYTRWAAKFDAVDATMLENPARRLG